MKQGQGVPLVFWVGFLALSLFALLIRMELTSAIEIKPGPPLSTHQAELNEAAKSVGLDPLYRMLPADPKAAPDRTRDRDDAGEAVGASLSGTGARERSPALLSLLLLGAGFLGLSGAAWWRYRRR